MAQNRIVNLYRAPARPRKPNTERTYTPAEQAALNEAKEQFQAFENRNATDTRRGKAARGPTIKMNLRRTRGR
jgi:hypothetical protein